MAIVSALRVYLFGPPRIEYNHTIIEIQRRKTLGLFIYLLVTGQPHSRDMLATLFWPDNDQSSARANLRRDISRLKKALGKKNLILDGDNVNWNTNAELWLDIRDFQFRLDEVASHEHSNDLLCSGCLVTLTDTVNLYADDFLAGFSLPDSPEFDDWQFFHTESLRRSLAESLQALIAWHTSSGDYSQAIDYARQWLALDNLHESAHQTLMRLYAWNGEQASALRQYNECARLLREKLQLQPDEETRALHEAIKLKQLQPPEKTIVVEQVTVPPSLHGFPRDVSPFIGREEELSTLVDMLQREDIRLVTVVALGGMGKTRLSIEAAKRFMEQHPELVPGGVSFLSLASVESHDALPTALAKELGLSLAGQEPLTELVCALENQRKLLVLDNFEQLVEGAPLLQNLLSRCAGLKMLVSSREPLRLSFEYRFDLGGLPYPSTGTTDGDEFESIRLFLQIARQVRPDFRLSEETRPQVYQLCAKLAGMPLAIKLAANWLRAMNIVQIVAKVERSLDILTSQMRDIPDRQRSMNAVFESTWNMLSSEEQRAFAALSVFRGGFFDRAAQQAADVSPYLLAGLVDHGLIRFLGGSRYEIHELTRQFAASKRRENTEASQVALSRHSAYYLDLVIQHGPAMYGQDPQAALQTLNDDLANIRFSWGWAVQNLSLKELRLVIEPLTAFYEIAGYLAIGKQAFLSAIQKHEYAAKRSIEIDALFTLLMHYALFLVFEGRWKEAQDYVVRIEAQEQALKDLSNQADMYQIKGLVEYHGDKKAEAVDLFRKAIEIYRSLNRPRRLIYSLNHMGEGLSYLLKPLDALRCHEEALQISQRIGERRLEALSLSHIGVSYYYTGEFEKAIEYWERAVESFEQVGDVRDNGRTRNNLSFVYTRLGEYEKAVQNGEKALAIMTQVGDRLNEANTSDTLGEAYFALGQYAEARQCFERAIRVSEEMLHDGNDPASFHTNLAQLELFTGRYAEAEQLLEQACSFEKGEGHPKEIANYLSVLADLYERTDRRQQALETLERGITLLHDADDQIQTSELLTQKAALFLADGKTDLAERHLDEAIQCIEKNCTHPNMFDAQILSARILHAKGYNNEAIQHLEAMHGRAKTSSQHAALHYYIWLFSQNREHARRAFSHYLKVLQRAPNVEYQARLLELKNILQKVKVAI